MYNLLLVDDEHIIVDSLFRLFNESFIDQLNVLKAYSGSEALKILSRSRVDIVVTDICMPNISGIELQKLIIDQWPRCRVVFLTGYDEFEYIKAALRGGSVDYVLKGEGDEAILAAVKKAILEIEKEDINQKLIGKAREQMERMIPLLQRQFIMDILQGVMLDKETIIKQSVELKIPLCFYKPVLMMLTRIDDWRRNSYSFKNHQIMYKVKTIVEEHLKDKLKLITIVLNDYEILSLAQPYGEGENINSFGLWPKSSMFLEGMLDLIQQSCRNAIDITVSHAITSSPYEWSDIWKGVEYLHTLLNGVYGLDKEIILTDKGNMEGWENEPKNNFDGFNIQQLLKGVRTISNYLENGDSDELREMLSYVFKTVGSIKNFHTGILKEIYYTIALEFQSFLNHVSYGDIIGKRYDLNSLMNIEAHDGVEGIETYFNGLAQCIFKVREERNTEYTNKVINRINKYVEKNLCKDLSLTILADMVHLNPSYLSRLYKKVTGIALSDYITELRLEKSKEMLLDEELKIKDIAVNLGFSSPTYFGRIFRKRFGITPQEFREMKGGYDK